MEKRHLPVLLADIVAVLMLRDPLIFFRSPPFWNALSAVGGELCTLATFR